MSDEPSDEARTEKSDEIGQGDATEQVPAGGVCRPSAGEASGAPDKGGVSEAGGEPTGILDRLERIQHEGPVEPMEGDLAELEDDPLVGEERVETKLRWEGPGKIVYEPTLYQVGPERFMVEARREKRGLIPWGFWGGLLFVGVALIVLAGAQNIYSLWDMLWALVGLTVGALLYRYGRKSTFQKITLCEIDRRRGMLHWPEGAQSGLEQTYLSVDDVTEVVFGMTRLPVDESSADVRVDAFALLVRTGDDELLPVVEGSPYKGHVHEIAKFLAEVTHSELTYVGRGIR